MKSSFDFSKPQSESWSRVSSFRSPKANHEVELVFLLRLSRLLKAPITTASHEVEFWFFEAPKRVMKSSFDFSRPQNESWRRVGVMKVSSSLIVAEMYIRTEPCWGLIGTTRHVCHVLEIHAKSLHVYYVRHRPIVQNNPDWFIIFVIILEARTHLPLAILLKST